MDNFPFPEEFDDIIYIGIIGKPKNIIISDPGFLLWGDYFNILNLHR